MKNYRNNTPPQQEGFVPPIIIIGMHRSGTSLIAKVLGRMGLFLGRDTEINSESYFFQRRNEVILNACNGGWENPAAIEELLKNDPTRERIIKLLRRDLQSTGISTYLGLGKYLRYRSAFRLNFPWGWKDPRNSILLPLWLQVFPNAKIISVLRNGIDSAASLADREAKRLRAGKVVKNPISESFKKFARFVSDGMPTYDIVAKYCYIMDRIAPQHKYLNHWTNRCLSIEYGFELWAYYTRKAFEWTRLLPSERLLLVKYEDFLQNPQAQLARMKAFAGVEGAGVDEKQIFGEIKPGRAYAFQNKPELAAFYEKVQNHPLMRQCGYGRMDLRTSAGDIHVN
jgi:Sulfotransferase family